MPRIIASLVLLPLLSGCALFFPNGDDDDDGGGGEADDVFIAVGDAGALLSSPDGVTWTTRTSGLGTALHDVAWGIDTVSGTGTYVIVGQAGRILTSHNGLDWLSGSSPSARDLNGVVFHIDRFFAVGGDYSAGGETLTSFDGTTWTRPELPAPLHVFTDIASDGTTLVAIGSEQSDQQIFGAFTWTEGLGWQQRIDGAVNGARYDAIASGVPAFALIGAGTAATSNDTITWQPTVIVAAPPMHGILYSAGGWIAVGDGGTSLSSADAFLWTSHASTVTTSLRGLTTDGNQYLAVGEAGTILGSLDGVTWTPQVSPLGVNLRSVTHPRE